MQTASKRAVAFGCAVAALVACNVFVTIDQCKSDADCPAGATCDPAGRYCLRLESDAAPPVDAAEAAVDADADAGVDAPDTGPPRCDPLAPFTSFTLVKGFETTTVISARLTPDETTIIYSALNGCADEACLDLFVAQRATLASPFGTGKALPAVNCNMAAEYWPTLSADGKVIFFESARELTPEGGACGNDRSRIWSASRVNTTTDFGTPRIDSLFAVDAGSNESSPYLHPSGRSLYFVSLGRPGAGGQDIYVATIDPLGLVSDISEVSPVNTPGAENFPVITLDEKTLFFARDDVVARDIWAAHRSKPGDAFGAPQRVAELSSDNEEIPAWVSDDQCRLYFASNRNPADAGAVADFRLWVAERTPK